MPLDEFGREIQPHGGSGMGPFADPLRPDAAAASALMDGPLAARRSGRSRSPDARTGDAGRSPSPHGRREYDDDRPHGGRGRRGRPRSDSHDDRRPRGGGGGRRHRSRSHGDDEREHRERHRAVRDRRAGGGTKAHASERYADQPLLCQFLWRKELEGAQAKELGLDDNKPLGEEKATEGGEGGEAPMDEEGKEAHPEPTTESGEAPAAKDESHPPPPLFETPEAESAAFAEYNAKHCLNYVRTFFNAHLDDPWFRARLSPLEQCRRARNERERASAEADAMKEEIVHSLEDVTKGVIPKKDPDVAEHLAAPKCNFVASCRLGVGTKPTSGATAAAGYDPYYHDGRDETDMQHDVLQGEDRNRIERHAKGHLHSFVRTEACVKVMDVPPNVSDEQLRATLAEHSRGPGGEPPRAVYSDDVCVPEHDNMPMDPYHRTAYAVFPTAAAKEAMLASLHAANEEADRRSRREAGRHRSKGEALPRLLDLDVDCTDVYGRREADADGKGSAPPAASTKKKDVEAAGRLPSRRCTVFVSTAPLAPSQPVSVLSAAVSSRERIARDKEDAATIASVLDEVRGIGAGSRLDDLLRRLYPGNELRAVDDEDLLDISIAYLRRVHLFSFYNGGAAASGVGNVLSYTDHAGTIHLRLRDADEIIAKYEEENPGVPPSVADDDADKENAEMKDGEGNAEEAKPVKAKDMLVTRLNDSIAKALEHVKVLAQRGPSCLVDLETDAAARDIESAEKAARDQWIENHGILDEDGRARCSFHFCRKLFKDKAFLHKHLLKKHSDQLRAECAKCHDGPMMGAWDEDERRPVPPVLVDCGSRFGLVPSAVTGSSRPMAHDPEPELWKEEQERMAEQERRRREREERERMAEEEERRRMEAANAGEKRKSNFVDPDDMVEEKVEISFDNVEAVVAPPKKKKRKKKSLL